MTSEQASRWLASRDWRQPASGRVMLPLDLTEAACGRCHVAGLAEGSVAAGTATLDHGRRLLAALGCTGCHPGGQVMFARLRGDLNVPSRPQRLPACRPSR